MKNEYYYLIAGLPELMFDMSMPSNTISELKDSILNNLTDDDKQLIEFAFYQSNNADFLNILNEKEPKNQDSTIKKEDVENLIHDSKSGFSAFETSQNENVAVPDYYREFLDRRINAQTDENSKKKDLKNDEEVLTSFTLKAAMNLKNHFAAEWFTLVSDVNNILSAFSAKKHNLDVEKFLIGDTPITRIIKKNLQAKDFGLTNEIPYYDKIEKISTEADILLKEYRIDRFFWDWLDEHTIFFNSFTIEVLFAYVCKLQILKRWAELSEQEGEYVFDKLISTLEKQVNMNETNQDN